MSCSAFCWSNSPCTPRSVLGACPLEHQPEAFVWKTKFAHAYIIISFIMLINTTTLVRLFVLYAPACLLLLLPFCLFCTHRRAYYCYSRSFVCFVRTGVPIATLVRLFVLYAPACLLLLLSFVCLCCTTHRRAYCYSRSFVCFVRTRVPIASLVSFVYAPACLLLLLSFVCLCTHRRAYCYSRLFVCLQIWQRA